MSENLFAEKARQMRESFDRAFALPAQYTDTAIENLLLIKTGTDPYGIKIAEIAGLFCDKKIEPVPSPYRAFLGLAGVKGSVVPVWDLGELLGNGAAPNKPRWFVIVAGTPAWALGFTDFEGCIKIPRSDLCPMPGQRASHLPETCRMAGGARPVLSLPSLKEVVQAYFQSPDKRRQTS